MRRTTIMLPDDIDARLRPEARRRNVAVAEVAREAIDAHLPASSDGRLGVFAIGEGSPPNASERVDEHVREAVAKRHD